METFYALLALCAGNSSVTGEFPSQRPVAGSFGVFFGLCLNKRLSEQSRGWWFETLSNSLWCHCNVPRGRIPTIYIHLSVLKWQKTQMYFIFRKINSAWERLIETVLKHHWYPVKCYRAPDIFKKYSTTLTLNEYLYQRRLQTYGNAFIKVVWLSRVIATQTFYRQKLKGNYRFGRACLQITNNSERLSKL